MVREISCNLSEKWVELPWELRSGTSWASSDKGLKDFCAIRLVTSKCWVDCLNTFQHLYMFDIHIHA